ncbi:MAG: site-specific integrase, partial [Clostridiales bacterium]|nr:site-specific integrase [Clostridiales bacterium]
ISKSPFKFKFTFKNDKKVRTALNKDEEEEFFNWLKNNPKWSISEWYNLLYFIRCTGVRISEAIGLTWSDIDFKQRTISINHQLLCENGKGHYIASPKSESGIRTLYITDEVMAILERLRKKPKCATIVDGYGGFIFYTHTGKVCRADNVSYQCKRLVTQFYEDTGIQITLTPHILRHTFCTRMAEQGMNPKTLQYIMGHSNVSITMNTYTHFNFDSVKDEIVRVMGNGSI